jgi:1-acyl-sn-glycerol-3-phosphate acyltransferase
LRRARAERGEDWVFPSPWPRFADGFARYMRRYVRRNFHAVRVLRGGLPRLPAGRPAVVYTNHPSWWDPALFVVLATHFFTGRPGFGPMDAAAFRKYRIMRRIGVFPIEADSARGAATFLRVTERVLAEPNAMLWITAQGHFADARERPLRLAPGTAHLAARLDGVALVPLALECTFWNERFPEALVAFGEPIESGGHRGGVDAWRSVLEERLTATMDRLAEAAVARDPARFETVLHGRTGIGGFYDLGRRLRALVRGERFSAAHGDDGRAAP